MRLNLNSINFTIYPSILNHNIFEPFTFKSGITLDDTIALLTKLKEKELDYIHVSTGHYMQSSIRNPEDQTPVLKTIIDSVGPDTPVIGVGSIKTPDDALKAIEELNLPLLAIGRELIAEPDWIEKVKTGKEATIPNRNPPRRQRRPSLPRRHVAIRQRQPRLVTNRRIK